MDSVPGNGNNNSYLSGLILSQTKLCMSLSGIEIPDMVSSVLVGVEGEVVMPG